MADLKTKEREVDPAAFVAAVTDERKRRDALALVALMERISGAPARMWGPSIIGFGNYHYRYESGHEGDMCRIGFSPRAALTLYVLNGSEGEQVTLDRLGKHKTGKSCLYIKTLDDVDVDVLEEIVAASWQHMAKLYPA